MSNPRSAEHLIERAAQRLQAGNAQNAAALNGATPVEPRLTPEGWHTPRHDAAAPAGPADHDASVPDRLELAALEAAGLMIGGPRRSRISEEYQIFSAQVMRRLQAPPRPGVPNNLMMITSSRPGEGKSFTAVNLAAALARTRRMQTLLIDGDPKKESLTVKLGLSDRKGLFDLANPDAPPIRTLAVPTIIDGLSVMPIGTVVGAHEATHHIGAAVDRLARDLPDHVLIVDAPPCLATSDASSLSPRVGHILMVVEADRIQRQDLEHALGMLTACPSIALVLNKIRSGAFNEFGAYGYYGG